MSEYKKDKIYELKEKNEQILKDKEKCKILSQTIGSITRLQTEMLIEACSNELPPINESKEKDIKNEIHEVKPGENIWRIIYNYAKKNGLPPIEPKKLEGFNITPGDKVILNREKVIVKYIDSKNNKTIYFENIKIQSEEKEIILKEKHKVEEKIDKKIDTTNKKTRKKENIKKVEASIKVKKSPKIEKQTLTNVNFHTIFDPESPIIGDQIAYKNEVSIRSKYGKTIETLIKNNLKGSIIDKDLVWSMIAKESRFNTKAISHTKVKGLAQITDNTIKTILDINKVRTKKLDLSKDIFITDEILTKGKIDSKKALQPINQIKLMISYLWYLEKVFDEIKDKNIKRDLIIASYNLGNQEIIELVKKYNIKNTQDLKYSIGKTNASKAKKEETKNYLTDVRENMKKLKDQTKLAQN